MGETIGIETDPVLKYKGVYDYEGFYKTIRSYFEQRKYIFREKRYKDKAQDFGHEVEMFLDADKEVDEFVKYVVELNVLIQEVSEFETEKERVKQKVTGGRLRIKIIKAEVEFDWQGKYSGKFAKKALTFFVKKMFKKYYLIRYVGPFRNDVMGLYTAIRKHLNMESS